MSTSVANEAAVDTRTMRRPRIGQRIVGATGIETITEVHDRGQWLEVTDRLGRPWSRHRAEAGCWTVVVEPVVVVEVAPWVSADPATAPADGIARTLDEARRLLADAESDLAADFGDELLDEAYPDIVDAVVWSCTPEVAAELRRITGCERRQGALR